MNKNTKTSGWDVSQYEKFSNERTQPFYDLLALIEPKQKIRMLDLGCGTGELTKVAHDRFQARETIGLDSSDTMLENSKKYVSDSLHFMQGDIENLNLESSFDLIISNAAFHWVRDHEGLIAYLTSKLTKGGQLAIQISANHDQPSHSLAFEIAEHSPFKELLKGFQLPKSVLSIEAYARILYKLGFSKQCVFQKVYPYVLPTRSDAVEWVKGTWLTAYKERLSASDYALLLAEYSKELMTRLPDEKPLFFPFKRTFLWGQW